GTPWANRRNGADGVTFRRTASGRFRFRRAHTRTNWNCGGRNPSLSVSSWLTGEKAIRSRKVCCEMEGNGLRHLVEVVVECLVARVADTISSAIGRWRTRRKMRNHALKQADRGTDG